MWLNNQFPEWKARTFTWELGTNVSEWRLWQIPIFSALFTEMYYQDMHYRIPCLHPLSWGDRAWPKVGAMCHLLLSIPLSSLSTSPSVLRPYNKPPFVVLSLAEILLKLKCILGNQLAEVNWCCGLTCTFCIYSYLLHLSPNFSGDQCLTPAVQSLTSWNSLRNSVSRPGWCRM